MSGYSVSLRSKRTKGTVTLEHTVTVQIEVEGADADHVHLVVAPRVDQAAENLLDSMERARIVPEGT